MSWARSLQYQSMRLVVTSLVVLAPYAAHAWVVETTGSIRLGRSEWGALRAAYIYLQSIISAARMSTMP
ncbi:hypothetical protein C8Q76DRAFT_726230 [Earliella scabrosa]|nr:hypothetical protein C8Q76DRAFT_726230 [Earliella scabrosa]